jgi:hypothetical protein
MCKDVNAGVLDFYVGVLPKDSNAEMSRRNDPPYVIITSSIFMKLALDADQ